MTSSLVPARRRSAFVRHLLRAMCALSLAGCVRTEPPPEAADAPLARALSPTVVDVPTDPFEQSPLYVLPVFYVPADRGYLVPDPTDPTVGLDGQPIGTARAELFLAAVNNVGTSLLTVQELYRRWLAHPNPEFERGTFRIATWNDGTHEAEVYEPGVNTLAPLIYTSDLSYQALVDAASPPPDLRRELADLMTTVGCKQTSCPFVFLITVVREDVECPTDACDLGACSCGARDQKYNQYLGGGGGLTVNQGFDGGTGMVLLPYWVPRYQADVPSISRPHGKMDVNLDGLLAHELGHAFGLSHVWEVYQHGDPILLEEFVDGPTIEATKAWTAAQCDARYEPPEVSHLRKYSLACSDSVMSYNPRLVTLAVSVDAAGVEQRIAGCVETATIGSTATCALPADLSDLDVYEGRLIPENIRNLSVNQRAFPNLLFEKQVDLGDDPVFRRHAGPEGLQIGQHERFVVVPGECGEGNANAVFGWSSNAIAHQWREFDPVRMWRGTAGAYVTTEITFPAPVQLERARIYTGDAQTPEAASLAVAAWVGGAWEECGAAPWPSANQEMQLTCSPSAKYRVVAVPAGGSDVTLRGVRLWGPGDQEFVPPREPRASVAQGGTSSGDPGDTLGTDATISDTPLLSPPNWVSGVVGIGGWAALQVEFPEDAELSGLRIYSDDPNEVRAFRFEYRDWNGSWREVASGLFDDDDLLTFAPVEARVWQLWVQAHPSDQVELQGLRFFSPDGELFEPGSHP